ncbi:MAG: thiamine-phosphate kinase [Candidatus Margulisiibacteriota bacterium]
MKLAQLGEFGLIELLAKQIGKPASKNVLIGIGDDAAAIKLQTSNFKHQNKSKITKQKLQKLLLITTDTFVENVHFKTKGISYKALGEKVLAANISDIAAMGGVPTYALVTIGASKNFQAENIELLYSGLKQLARKYQIDIIGGDTISSPKELIISVTLLGEVEQRQLMTRGGAKPGDLVLVTGEFGGPAAQKYRVICLPAGTACYALRVTEAQTIARSRLATAMIDSSDGLMRSVREICRQSRTGAKIWTELVPRAAGATPDQALNGGEEYELVLTAPKNKAIKLMELVRRRTGTKVTVVGAIAPKSAGITPANAKGYEHFK